MWSIISLFLIAHQIFILNQIKKFILDMIRISLSYLHKQPFLCDKIPHQHFTDGEHLQTILFLSHLYSKWLHLRTELFISRTISKRQTFTSNFSIYSIFKIINLFFKVRNIFYYIIAHHLS